MSASGRINELPNNYSHNHLQQWRQAQKTSRRPWCYRLAGLTSWSNTVADQSWMFPNDVTVATFTCTVHLTIQALVYRKCIKCNTKTFQPWTQEWCLELSTSTSLRQGINTKIVQETAAHLRARTTRYDSLNANEKLIHSKLTLPHETKQTRSSAVAERPLDALCRWTLREVSQGHSKSLLVFYRNGTRYIVSKIVSVQLWCDLEIFVSFKLIGNGTIQKLGHGFLFAFYRNYGRIFSHFWDI